MILHIDFETRSIVDLSNEGAYKYAAHSSTQIICMGWAFEDNSPEIWTPDQKFPKAVCEHINANEPRTIHAHNAQFERLITGGVLSQLVNFQIPDIDSWYCTAAQARARALPASLDDLGACLGLRHKKDKRGKELIRLLCVPRINEQGAKTFNQDPDLLEEMYEYCKQDVRVERLAARMTPPLTDTEHDDWVVSEIVNDTGLLVDREFAAAAAQYADEEMDEISSRLKKLTCGKIASPRQYQRIKDYILPLMEEDGEVQNAITVVKTDRRTGEEQLKISLDKDARRKLMALEEVSPGRLPEKVFDLIKLADEAGRSSVHKYNSMVRRAGTDDRVRGAYIFSGAGQTGRYSSNGLQVHNMPRNSSTHPDLVREQVMRHEPLPDVMSTLSSMLRPSIVAAPGHQFVCGDWSAIEARILPWLSASDDGQKVLNVFDACDKDPGAPDIYMIEASELFGIAPGDINKEQRSFGKVEVLACGYQGGHRAFQAMARNYNLSITDEHAGDIVRVWRNNNPWAPDFWSGLQKAAIDALLCPGEEFPIGRLTYCHPNEVAPLYCQLPSGRVLSYPQPELKLVEGPYGENYELTAIKAQWKPKRGETEWGRISLYGGLLAENATQATAACILRYAMGLTIDDDWSLVGTTHDELLIEVRDHEVNEAREGLEAIMLETPAWAEGLPMAVEIWSGKHYRK
jgi:DNA polymerase bacteriophage-type